MTTPRRMLLRLNYLCNVGTAHVLTWLFWMVGVAAFVVTLMALVTGSLMSLMYLTSSQWAMATFLFAGTLTVTIASGLLTFSCVCLCEFFFDRTDLLPYVPPLRDQIAYLPAREVLLRESGNPFTSTHEALLRAAGSQETCTEDLLRPHV